MCVCKRERERERERIDRKRKRETARELGGAGVNLAPRRDSEGGR